MARRGLYKSDVQRARDALRAQGKHPSVDAVRVALGNTGVTKVGVVERGTLRRDVACEDKEDCRGKILEVRSGAGVGGLPQS